MRVDTEVLRYHAGFVRGAGFDAAAAAMLDAARELDEIRAAEARQDVECDRTVPGL